LLVEDQSTAARLVIKQGIQAERKHKALDQSSQAEVDADASIQYMDSCLQISSKSQQVLCQIAALNE
jgi:hypothetical protein